MLSRKYDEYFERYRGQVPLPYVRALAKRESNLNPCCGYKPPSGPHDPAWGILQVVEVVRQDFNKSHATNYTRYALLDPDVCTRMACEVLNRIVNQYQKHSHANMKQDWTNPEFVKLVTMGWNSGYSEKGGVGRVAAYLEARGIDVTHDNIFAFNASAGGVKFLSEKGRWEWQRSVQKLFFEQEDFGGPPSSPPSGGGSSSDATSPAIAGIDSADALTPGGAV